MSRRLVVRREKSYRPVPRARLWFTMYCEESATPSLLLVDADTTNFTAAFRATAPAHSTSMRGLALFAVQNHTGIRPVHDHRRIVDWKAHPTAKSRYIGGKNVAAARNRDGLPRAVAAATIERPQVIDRGEILRRQIVGAACREIRPRLRG